ncbi:hypothetical protein STRDD10_01629 [Streptococcus sp. DD10]|uniref:hypothetical protein n=1 Tax=Streptococcus sp. DD10 TaxID=1777878 RepID=UPI0007927D18|nr:hypothetical protein [Streptococcus sp. DD10]KXT73154.1 hypothetical protein STRDD10_01629 [Streptococcus sp. DD10]
MDELIEHYKKVIADYERALNDDDYYMKRYGLHGKVIGSVQRDWIRRKKKEAEKRVEELG